MIFFPSAHYSKKREKISVLLFTSTFHSSCSSSPYLFHKVFVIYLVKNAEDAYCHPWSSTLSLNRNRSHQVPHSPSSSAVGGVKGGIVAIIDWRFISLYLETVCNGRREKRRKKWNKRGKCAEGVQVPSSRCCWSLRTFLLHIFLNSGVPTCLRFQ